MKRLGQHFLINKAILKKIAAALEIRNGETIIEIGPGHGELTSAILNYELGIKNYGGKVIAIEKDPELVSFLKKKFAKTENLEIMEGDVREKLPEIVRNLKLRNYLICGNIPYYLTGYLFRILSGLERKPEKCVFMVQKEVAERIAAKPPHMNRLAASIQFWAEPRLIMEVKRDNFRPQPEVDSAIISLTLTDADQTPRPGSGQARTDAERYYKTVKILFQQPRKTILNNISQKIKDISKEKIIPVLKEMKINPQDRPQNLKIDDIIKLSGLF